MRPLDFSLELGIHAASISRSLTSHKCTTAPAACDWTHIVCARSLSGVPCAAGKCGVPEFGSHDGALNSGVVRRPSRRQEDACRRRGERRGCQRGAVRRRGPDARPSPRSPDRVELVSHDVGGEGRDLELHRRRSSVISRLARSRRPDRRQRTATAQSTLRQARRARPHRRDHVRLPVARVWQPRAHHARRTRSTPGTRQPRHLSARQRDRVVRERPPRSRTGLRRAHAAGDDRRRSAHARARTARQRTCQRRRPRRPVADRPWRTSASATPA